MKGKQRITMKGNSLEMKCRRVKNYENPSFVSDEYINGCGKQAEDLPVRVFTKICIFPKLLHKYNSIAKCERAME